MRLQGHGRAGQSDEPERQPPVPASLLLEKLYARIPADRFTLGWLTEALERQSFGAMILLFGVLSAGPAVVSIPAQLLLLVPAAQMVAGGLVPHFSRWITSRSLPSRALGTALKGAIPVLRVVEKAFYPRWPMRPWPTKLVVGLAVIGLTLRMLLNPLPFSNMIPAAVVVLISLSYLEEDGLMLMVALFAGVIGMGIDVIVLSQIAHFAPR